MDSLAQLRARRPEIFVTYSKDREAVRELAEWQNRRRSLPLWKRSERRQADAQVAATRQRCLDAGIDWERVPRPPADLRPPDRSTRAPIGPVLPGGVCPVAPDVPAQQAVPATGGSGKGPAAAGGAAGGAMGVFAGMAAYGWIMNAAQRPDPVAQLADGSSWYQDPTGDLWFADPSGGIFFFSDQDSFLALSDDGLLWADAGGGLMAFASDGTSMVLHDDGHLHLSDAQGNDLLVGEDGSFYAEGADGSFYTMGADGSFYGIDEHGDYFAAPEGSGFGGEELEAAAFDDSGDGSWWESI